MGSRVLFNEQHIYDFVETQRAKLKKAYEVLPDDRALDEAFTQDLKRQFIPNIPILKPDKWEAEERPTEIVVYLPFEGDPSVFKISPSAFDGTVAIGEVIGQDLLITVSSPFPNFDVAAHVRCEIRKIEWRLNNLRSSMEHMNQQLEIQIRESISARKRSVENKARVRQELNIPLRKRPSAPVPAAQPKLVAHPTPKAQEKPVQANWDIFMSHASTDKHYVRGLVKALRDKGITVWFDDDCIAWGEPVRQAVKKGLHNSRYGIVVLSKAYLADRKWTEHEFDGLFARERVNSFIILPIWHGVNRDEVEQYDPALADRRGSISDTDNCSEIVESVLKLLDRVPNESDAQSAYTPTTPAARKYGPDERELVAYVWYYTPDGKGAQMYVRKLRNQDDRFTLEEPNGPVHEGTREVIADKYSSTDRHLLRSGLKHHVMNSSSAYQDFTLVN